MTNFLASSILLYFFHFKLHHFYALLPLMNFAGMNFVNSLNFYLKMKVHHKMNSLVVVLPSFLLFLFDSLLDLASMTLHSLIFSLFLTLPSLNIPLKVCICLDYFFSAFQSLYLLSIFFFIISGTIFSIAYWISHIEIFIGTLSLLLPFFCQYNSFQYFLTWLIQLPFN